MNGFQGFLKKAFGGTASRLALSRNSRVFPAESTARYKYFGFPFTSIYVSSTRQESLVALR